MKKIICFVFSFVFILANAVNAASLSDGEAASIMLSKLSRLYETLPLGLMMISPTYGQKRPDYNLSEKTISDEYLKELKLWEAQGVITLSNWQASTPNKLAKVNITATPEGLALQKEFNSNGTPRSDYLRILASTSKITNIVRNEEKKAGIDDYRIIMFSFNMQFTPVFKAVKTALKVPLAEERKGIALVKYDPFQKKWQLIEWDLADQNANFTTSRVNDYLVKKGLTK